MDLDPGTCFKSTITASDTAGMFFPHRGTISSRTETTQIQKNIRQPIISVFINRDVSDCIGVWHHWRKSGPLLFTALLRFIEVCSIRPCTALWAFLFQSFWCRSAVLGSSAVGQTASHWYTEEFVVHSVTVRSLIPLPLYKPAAVKHVWLCGTAGSGLDFWGRNSKVVGFPS